MALSRDVVIRLLGDADSAVKAQKAAADAAGVSAAAYRRAEREQDKQTKAMEAAATKQRAAMDKIGRGSALMGAAMVAGLGLTTKAAIDWETAWTGVTKVVSGTPAQMNDLERSLRRLATTLPATHEEIAAVAASAGQLGVARKDITEFTKVAIELGVSTNLSAEDAANGLARLSNITGTSARDVDRLGSVLVALGNAGASTEQEILDMSLRIAAAGHQAHMTDGDIMGIANAMSSMGIEAEAGGSSISRVIKTINSSVISGGKELDKFAKLAGTSSQQFADAWNKDAAKALQSVVAGLGRVQDSGGDANAVLADLGLNNIRISDTMLRLAANSDLLGSSVATGNKAWAQNNALVNEANRRFETTASKLQIARNQINDAAIDVGATFLPVLAKGATFAADFARGIEELPGPVKTVAAVLGLAAGGIGLVGGAALIAVPKVVAFRGAMQTLATSSSAAARGVSKFGLFMTGPWGAAIGLGVTLLGGLVTALGSTSRASQEAAQYTDDLATALRDQNGAIDDNIRKLAAKKAEDSGILKVAQKAGISLSLVTDALLGNRDAYEQVTTALENYAAHHRGVAGVAAAAKAAHDAEGTAALAARDKLDELSGSMGAAIAENQRLADAAGKTGQATAAGATGIGAATGAMSDFAAQTGDAEQELEDWIKKLASIGEAFVDPLDVYEGLLQDKQEAEQASAQDTADSTKSSKDSWKDYVKDVSVSLDEYATELEKQITAQEDWRDNLVRVAQRGGIEVAQILAGMGQRGAELTAKMATATDANFQRMAQDLIKDAQLGGQGAASQLDTAMKVMAAIGAAGGKATAQSIAEQLGIGADTVARIAAQYGMNLADGINPLMDALGKPRIGTVGGNRIARFLDNNADGNLYESHTAQIAPAGAMRLWAEPETGGEAYIPLHPAKRARSVAIWRETGRRLNQYAAGGFASAEDVPRPYSTAPYGPPLSTAADATMGREYQVVTDWLRANVPTVSGVSVPATAVAAIVRSVAASFGWGAGAEWDALAWIISHESGWRNTAQNPTSTAYGLFQFLNGTWAGTGIAKTSDPRLQSVAGMRYIGSRYGDPIGAQRFWAMNGWYADGTDYVQTTGPAYLHASEAVLNPREAAAYRTGLAASAGMPVGSRSAAARMPAPQVTVQARVFVGNREITDIARVEATAAVNGRLEDWYRKKASR